MFIVRSPWFITVSVRERQCHLSLLICCLVTVHITVCCYVHFVTLFTSLFFILSQNPPPAAAPPKKYDLGEIEKLIYCILFPPLGFRCACLSIDLLRTRALD